MNLEPEQYKELNQYSIIQFPALRWLPLLTFDELYSGGVSLGLPPVPANEYKLLIPSSIQSAKVYLIDLTIVGSAFVASTGIVTGGSVRIDPIYINATAPANFLINEIPYSNKIFHRNLLSLSTSQLSSLTFREIFLGFTSPLADLVPNVNFAPDPAQNVQFDIYIKPNIKVIF